MKCGDLNFSWRVRRFDGDYDHLYGVFETPIVLCTREPITKGFRAHQLPDPSIVGYLHPSGNLWSVRKDTHDPADDTPINECPDCQDVLTMMRLAE